MHLSVTHSPYRMQADPKGDPDICLDNLMNGKGCLWDAEQANIFSAHKCCSMLAREKDPYGFASAGVTPHVSCNTSGIHPEQSAAPKSYWLLT